jgi:hypothetical protein
MNNYLVWSIRILLGIIFVVGYSCFLFPEAMIVLPWEWRGGFMVAMFPGGLFLFLELSVASIHTILKSQSNHWQQHRN